MRRFLVLFGISALFVVSVVLFSSAQADGCEDDAIVSSHIISDSFEGTSISPKVWGFYGTNQPSNVTLTQLKSGNAKCSEQSPRRSGFSPYR